MIFQKLTAILLFFGCFTISVYSQTDSQVFLLSIEGTMDGPVFSVPKNISQNTGYNNQPFFSNDSTLLYARNQKGQTDIASYAIKNRSTIIFNTETPGSEYSPQSLPNSKDVTAVRLDIDGTQELYRYERKGAISHYLPNEKIAYYTFYSKDTLVASILSEGDLDLMVYSTKENKKYKLLTKSGRSFQKVPNTQAIAYTAINEQGNLDLYQLDMPSLESFFVCELPIGIQDYVWLNDSQIIIGSGSQLFLYDLFGDGDWQAVGNFSANGITNITRLAVSPNKNLLAFVAELKPK